MQTTDSFKPVRIDEISTGQSGKVERETNQIIERFSIICIPLEILFVDETFDSMLDHW